MKKSSTASRNLRIPILLAMTIISLLFFPAHQKNIFAQASRIKFNIKETPEIILIRSKAYSLTIDKVTAEARLKNWQDISYTTFPLDIQFQAGEMKNSFAVDRRWKIRDKMISMTADQNGIMMQELKISCTDEAFEIKLGTLVPSNAKDGVFLFRRNDQGFDTAEWDQFFSPEPDDFFRTDPTVDVRVQRDQQWVFTPAPLNLSFKTAAGWFSIGLAELPDASVYRFKDKAIWLDFAWQKLRVSAGQLYWFPALVFTFNESPWEAVGDFSQYIRTNYSARTKPSRAEVKPDWWRNPLVSTWGEQSIQRVTSNHPDFASDWVQDYVKRQEAALACPTFTLIIDDNWSRAYGDPHPSNRFRNLRALIDSCHSQGHKVILFWKAWKVEASSIATDFNLLDGEYVDATHLLFESYVDSCCQILFSSDSTGLNADGIKIDYLFLARNPATANYANAANGMGMKEVRRYLEIFYQQAKKYKPDALIMSTAIDPHFSDVQDMVRIHDDWDNKTVREKRARIITQALPEMLINGDGVDMSIKIANYHFVTSAIYGIPSIQYLTRYPDGKIESEDKLMLSQLLQLYARKPVGRLKFVDYGNWQIIDKNGDVSIESIRGGKGLLFFNNNSEASFLCTENSRLHLVFERHLLKSILDEGGMKVPFTDLGNGLYELTALEQGKIYKFELKKASTKSR